MDKNDKKKWKFVKRTEREYFEGMNQLTSKVKKVAKKHDTVEGITTAIKELTNDPVWEVISEQLAFRMVKSVVVQNAKTWREASRKGTRSREIHRLLRSEFENHAGFYKIIQRNSELIQNLPKYIAREMSQQASIQAVAGKRSSELVKEIRLLAPKITEKRAQLIARTETAKAQSAITEIRSTQIGVNWYVWRTVGDARTRSSHVHMNGVVCNFHSPPAPESLAGIKSTLGHYNAGGAPNCRCYAEPIIVPEELKTPIEVLINGQIRKFNKAQLKRLVS